VTLLKKTTNLKSGHVIVMNDIQNSSKTNPLIIEERGNEKMRISVQVVTLKSMIFDAHQGMIC
jgi:hypothetical protein